MSEQVLNSEQQERLFERFSRVATTITTQIDCSGNADLEKMIGSRFNSEAHDNESQITISGDTYFAGKKEESLTYVLEKDEEGIVSFGSGKEFSEIISHFNYNRTEQGPLTQKLASKLITDFAKSASTLAPAEYSFERVTTLICGTKLSEHEHAVMTPYDKADAFAARL